MQKIFFFALTTLILYTGYNKKNSFISPIAPSARNATIPQSNASGEDVTFVLTHGNLTITGAIEATGTYTMDPVIQTGKAYHCTNNLVTPEGTITALTNCQDASTGTWRIISATGAYANLQGNGRLVMYPGGKTWAIKIF